MSWWVKAASDNYFHVREVSPYNRVRAFWLTKKMKFWFFERQKLKYFFSCLLLARNFRVQISQDMDKNCGFFWAGKPYPPSLKIFGHLENIRNPERTACLEGLYRFWLNLNLKIQGWKYFARKKWIQPFHTSEQAWVELKLDYVVISISEKFCSSWKVTLQLSSFYKGSSQ